jgi:rare lipoprotein A
MTTRTASRLATGVLAGAALLLSGCGSMTRSGGYYQDDGPHERAPVDVSAIPDAVPRHEPYRAANSKPYTVLGVGYTPLADARGYRERGIASWYGKKFHGKPTASGESYDMYAMTAAHRTLPLPCYVRVRNLENGRSVVVRVNDRGPFLHNRLIDLSYSAAARLGIVDRGTGIVEVEVVGPESPTIAVAVNANAVDSCRSVPFNNTKTPLTCASVCNAPGSARSASSRRRPTRPWRHAFIASALRPLPASNTGIASSPKSPVTASVTPS